MFGRNESKGPSGLQGYPYLSPTDTRKGPSPIVAEDASCPTISPTLGIEEKVTGSGELKVTLTGWLSGILRGVKLLYYQILISTYRHANILRSESSGAPDL